jgi:hypothetical protein
MSPLLWKGSSVTALRLIASDWRSISCRQILPCTRPNDPYHTSHLPVILVTGKGNHEVLENFGEARTLQKPYTETELMEKIARALS